jgi:imidazolonepropionase-like amidohydrolase
VKPASTIGRVLGGGISYIVAGSGVRLRLTTAGPRGWICRAKPFLSQGLTMTLRFLLFVVLAAAAAVAPTTAQQNAPVKAFTGMRLIDGTDRAPIDNATVVVRDGRIVAAGAAASVTIPAGAERVSLTGKHVIPGLINAHGHANSLPRDLETYAKYGVTTVFSLGNDGNAPEALAARQAQSAPTLARARIFTSGPVISPTTPDEAREQVAKIAAMKADTVKIRVDDNLGTTAKMTPEVYRAVIDEAHKRNLRVAVHLFYLSDTKGLLDAGADFIAHSIRDLEVDSDVIAKMKARGVCLSPTLMREVSTYVYESTPAFFSDPLFLKYSDPQWINQRKDPALQAKTAKDPAAQRYKKALEVASRNMKKLADAGVPIAMGTDTGPPGRFMGYFELMELELMAKAGMTPKQVLQSATRDAARCHKVDADLGTLEPKRWADFVVLDADPLANVSNTRQISDVYIAGNRVAR